MEILVGAIIGAAILFFVFLVFYAVRQRGRAEHTRADIDQREPNEPYRKAPPGRSDERYERG